MSLTKSFIHTYIEYVGHYHTDIEYVVNKIHLSKDIDYVCR